MISLLARFFMLPKPQASPAPEPVVVKKKRSVKKPAAKKPTPKSRAKKKA
jgi:hypothetical protein